MKINKISIILLYISLLIYIGISPALRIINEITPNKMISLTPIVSLAIIVYMFFNIKEIVTNIYNRKLYLMGIFILVWIIAIQIVSLPVMVENYGWEKYKITIGTTIITTLFMWICGININNIYELFNKNRLIRIITYIIALLYIVSIVYSIQYQMKLNGIGFENFKIYRNGWTLDYLYIGDTFVFITLLISPWIKHRKIRLSIYTLNLLLIYSLMSRTAFYLYIISLLVLIITSKEKGIKIKFSILVTILFVLSTTMMNTEIIEDNRMFNIGSQDKSITERNIIQQESFEDLKNIWILGEFMREFGTTGEGKYMHNIYSYWVCYGILPFIFMCIYLVVSYIYIFRLSRLFNEPIVESILLLATYWVIATFFSRSYSYPYIWFSLGAISVLNYNNKVNGLKRRI